MFSVQWLSVPPSEESRLLRDRVKSLAISVYFGTLYAVRVGYPSLPNISLQELRFRSNADTKKKLDISNILV